ncbi:hypothetical protein [Confluentibacter sediminis]|uniref:hypothetical protein n=1 Tax=Confluentibacter sediminis TaxID=2219045 RepID=UPI000DAEEA21|nr:hypothetical protein [Confluentibacter sediminis]
MKFLKRAYFHKIGLFIVFIFFYIFLYFKYKAVNDKLIFTTNSLENTEQLIELYSDFSGYYQFRKDYKITSINNNSLFLEDLIKKQTVVLFIDEFNCDSCVIDAISKMEYATNGLLHLDLDYIIFASGYNMRNLRLLVSNKKVKTPVFKIEEDSPFIRKMKKSERPFFFILDKNLEVSSIIFPQKNKINKLENRYLLNYIK